MSSPFVQSLLQLWFVLMLSSTHIYATSYLEQMQPDSRTVTELTEHGTYTYYVDNSGEVDVSNHVRTISDELSAQMNVSATIILHVPPHRPGPVSPI